MTMPSITNLYIEPTSHCNLSCPMCSRNHWRNETIGHMSDEVFERAISNLPDSVHRIFFGGIGEPLTHPKIVAMIHRAKQTGRTVEMISNGTLLDKKMGDALIEERLDKLWVSLDSLHEKGYEATHKDAPYSDVVKNIEMFSGLLMKRQNAHRIRMNPKHHDTASTRLGIVFVLMKSNLDQFGLLLKTAHNSLVSDIKATHLIPYDISDMSEICYDRILGTDMFGEKSGFRTNIDLPLMESKYLRQDDILDSLSNPNFTLTIMGEPLRKRKNWCKFVNEGHAFVRWDGEVCPCMALLHDNHFVTQNTVRHNRYCSFGTIKEQSLLEIWDSQAYADFRKRVIDFSFSPCITCGPCNMFGNNETDCLGNPFPTCGACLWAQGLFQCP